MHCKKSLAKLNYFLWFSWAWICVQNVVIKKIFNSLSSFVAFKTQIWQKKVVFVRFQIVNQVPAQIFTSSGNVFFLWKNIRRYLKQTKQLSALSSHDHLDVLENPCFRKSWKPPRTCTTPKNSGVAKSTAFSAKCDFGWHFADFPNPSQGGWHHPCIQLLFPNFQRKRNEEDKECISKRSDCVSGPDYVKGGCGMRWTWRRFLSFYSRSVPSVLRCNQTT